MQVFYSSYFRVAELLLNDFAIFENGVFFTQSGQVKRSTPVIWEWPFMRHSYLSLIVREGQELAESVSTASIQKSQPAAWRTSVVAPNSDVGTDSI